MSQKARPIDIMEDNRTKPSVKTYLLHWFDYCYYRIVQLYTPEGTKDEDMEYGCGSIMVGAFFANIILIILEKFNIGISEFIHEHKILYALIVGLVSCFIFPETMYYRAETLFGKESRKTRIILGILVFLTMILPLILVILIFW